MTNDLPRTIPFGVRVKLNREAVLESQGRHGTTLDPQEWGDEWIIRSLEANPHFNLVLLDGDTRPIFMMDRSLDLVEMLPRCFLCTREGGYLVVVPWGKDEDGQMSIRTLCVDCHEARRQEANKCATCGYKAEQGKECVSCMTSRLEREGNEISEQFEREQEAFDSFDTDEVRLRSWREDFHADG